MTAGIGAQALRPLEVASGLLYGLEDGSGPLADPGAVAPPRAALDHAIRPALLRAPCVVSFSGGRDSSAVLAAAADLARRESLPPPIPVTLRFPRPESDESTWQELVVRHLGLHDWVRLELEHELDVVGPHAVRLLQRHGPVFPHNTHFHLPIAEVAKGGTVLTGIGGDELLLPSRWKRTNHVLRAKARPRWPDAVELPLAALPRSLRARAFARTDTRVFEFMSFPWMRPDANAELRRRFAEDTASEPIGWHGWVRRWWWPSRWRVACQQSLDLVGEIAGATMVSPLEDPTFLWSASAEKGPFGYRSRTAAMLELFGDVLPVELVARSSKAVLPVFWTRRAYELARTVEPDEVDRSVIDPGGLRQAWSDPEVADGHSLLLLQAIWARRHAGSSLQRRQ